MRAADGDYPLRLGQELLIAELLFAYLDEGRAAADGGFDVAAEVVGPGPVRDGVERECVFVQSIPSK